MAEEKERLAKKHHTASPPAIVVPPTFAPPDVAPPSAVVPPPAAVAPPPAATSPTIAAPTPAAAPPPQAVPPADVPAPSEAEAPPPTSLCAVAPPPSAAPPLASTPLAMPPASAWKLADGARTLAFPSLSTCAFAFDVHRAASTLLREVAKFLRQHPNDQLALLLVEPAGEAREALLATKHAEPGLEEDGRFAIAAADVSLPALRAHGAAARVIANAANHKLNAKPTTRVNKAVYAAAGGAELEALTRARHGHSGRPGEAYCIELPAGNALREAESVTHVVHLVGPNMNPAKPECLDGDYATGCAQLGDTYAACFAEFHRLLELS